MKYIDIVLTTNGFGYLAIGCLILTLIVLGGELAERQGLRIFGQIAGLIGALSITYLAEMWFLNFVGLLFISAGVFQAVKYLWPSRNKSGATVK